MKWPDSLVKDIAARRVVLFIGAGVSMNSLAMDGKTRTKSWPDFLKAGANRLGSPKKKLVIQVKELIERNDLLTACEVIKNSLGRQEFVDFMQEEFQAPGFRPAPIHEALWGLDLRITVTPNVDTIYDNFVADRGAGTVTVKTYKDADVAEAIRRRSPVLIKSHGTIGSPNALIFTRSEYARARNEHRQFYELMYSLLSTYTFLFVGCGLEDPDIRYLLEDYRYRNSFTQTHFFTMPDGQYVDEVKRVYSESLNLEFVPYSSDGNHAELGQGLRELGGKVELARQDIGRRNGW
ncbi:SIR2 family protein [Pseudoxanthomonas mexicana]|uniref:SIR2 family protein n=1 Tax=Pseudoxanthomonas mexicana TaxID=128785 RepID=UPI0022F392F0|nr:SIR2 family protein [Pseudoxanthomonas mexicana]WBX93386.1 SIR2 family protein [Pseudoxanthomonas mexicana]